MIRQPWLFAVSMVCLLIAIGFTVERTIFLLGAERTQGTVVAIDGRNATCGKKKHRYSCTQFTATVHYTIPSGAVLAIDIGAGSSRGSDQPATNASRRTGDPVRVVYSPKNPSKAYQDSFFGVWGAPVIAAVFQIATLFGSMAEGRRRRW